MGLRTSLFALTATMALATAQTQIVRGDVDILRRTNPNVYRLDCTTIRLVSTSVDLLALHNASRQQDFEYEMQVRDVSSGGVTILDVVSARRIPELLDMGNLRLGRSDSWEVLGTPGDAAAVFLTGEAMTSYLPAGSFGTWVLGPVFVPIRSGTVSSTGQFRFQFQPPNDPSLVGASFTAQALTGRPGTSLLITNPQCKEVRSN